MKSTSDSTKTYSIALLIETSSVYGRQILRGIQRFIQTENKQDWIAVIEERDVHAGVPNWIKNWSGDGIISRRMTSDLEYEVRKRNLPFVQLTDRIVANKFTVVRSDDEAIGREAAEHFCERGLQNFAFCGFRDEAWSDRRRFGFQQYADSIENSTFHSFRSTWFWQNENQRDEEQASLTLG